MRQEIEDKKYLDLFWCMVCHPFKIYPVKYGQQGQNFILSNLLAQVHPLANVVIFCVIAATKIYFAYETCYCPICPLAGKTGGNN
jgi:hypothetical protein